MGRSWNSPLRPRRRAAVPTVVGTPAEPGAEHGQVPGGAPVLTVTELCDVISTQLGASSLLQATTVRGEVVDPQVSKQGHTYFTLRDANSAFACIRWASVLGEPLIEGRVYDVVGDVSLWPVRGQIRLIASRVRELDAGERHRALVLLTERLRSEGVFDPSRKRSLPRWPSRIGVATSAEGAVIHDVRTIIGTRMPLAEIVLAPCPVQGIGAASGIVNAVWALGERGVDVIIVARGGGSADDLAAFNDESVVRAVRAISEEVGVPVISAIGHETDTTLCDHAADIRAPTPTAAAQIVVPDAATIRGGLLASHVRVTHALERRLTARGAALRTINRRLDLSSRTVAGRVERRLDAIHDAIGAAVPARVDAMAVQLASLDDRGHRAMEARIARPTTRLTTADSTLRLVSPRRVLERGYAIIERQTASDSHPTPVASIDGLRPGDAIRVRFRDGVADATVASVTTSDPASVVDGSNGY